MAEFKVKLDRYGCVAGWYVLVGSTIAGVIERAGNIKGTFRTSLMTPEKRVIYLGYFPSREAGLEAILSAPRS